MMNKARLLITITILFLSNLVFSQSKQYILILSKGENKLNILDYYSLEITTKIPVGNGPHEIVTNTSGSRAYVSIPEMNNNGHEIDVINLKTLQRDTVIDTSPLYIPHGLVYRNNELWFTAQGSKAVGIYDLNSMKIKDVFGTGQDFTHLLYVTSDNKSFYTTNVESGTISIFENKHLPPYMPPTGTLPPNAKDRYEWRQTLIDVGLGAEGFEVSPDEKELWTARPDGHIIVVDLLEKKIKSDINTGIEGLHRLKFTPDGKRVCIVSVKTGDLLFYNAQTQKLEQKLNIGQGAGIYMDKESNRMFISCTPNNYVVVYDLSKNKIIKQLNITKPDGITAVIVR